MVGTSVPLNRLLLFCTMVYGANFTEDRTTKPIRRGHHVVTRGFKAMITLNSRCRDAADTEENEASHVKLGRCKRSRCRLLASRAVPAET